ncbi:restriction endonuclease subunit S [Psychrobacter sp. Ps4]|nr:restriction endonuclease subunit S [Psychrobacter sp. Ps4]
MDEGVVVLRSNNIKNGRLDLSSPSFTNEEGYQARVKRAIPESGDLVLTREAPMGEVCQIPEGLRCCLGQRMVLLRVKKEVMDSRFLLFALQSPYLQHQISWNEGTGTTVSNIRIPNIKAFQIPTPPFKEQKAIAHTLGCLDDKIELNRQMNETLEAMAQALFKSWFIDFDPVIDNALAAGNVIPDEFIERAEQRKGIEKKDNSDIQDLFPDTFEFTEEMGWIPESWEVTPLAALIKLTGGGTPKTSIPEYWNGDIPWFSVVDAPSSSDVFVLDTEKHVTSLGVENSSTKILSVGTTIISARGTVGKCAMVSRPMAMNQSCYGVSGNEGISNTFVYYSVFLSVSELQSKGHGSVFNTITGDTFKSINVAFSGGRLTREFDNLVSPYFEKILANSLQVKTLSKLRDTLLPKLMSGELRIPDAETLVDEAL